MTKNRSFSSWCHPDPNQVLLVLKPTLSISTALSKEHKIIKRTEQNLKLNYKTSCLLDSPTFILVIGLEVEAWNLYIFLCCGSDMTFSCIQLLQCISHVNRSTHPANCCLWFYVPQNLCTLAFQLILGDGSYGNYYYYFPKIYFLKIYVFLHLKSKSKKKGAENKNKTAVKLLGISSPLILTTGVFVHISQCIYCISWDRTLLNIIRSMSSYMAYMSGSWKSPTASLSKVKVYNLYHYRSYTVAVLEQF